MKNKGIEIIKSYLLWYFTRNEDNRGQEISSQDKRLFKSFKSFVVSVSTG